MKDTRLTRQSKVALKHLIVPIVTAVSLTDANVFRFTPGYGFRVEGVSTFCRTKAGAVTADVLVGATVVANDAAFTANAEVAATLTEAARKGKASDEVLVRITTDGTGALTNGVVVVTLRPYPLGGEY